MISATGQVVKHVNCVSCGHRYRYLMSRTAYGSYSGFAKTQAEADRRAAQDAAERFERKLESDCDLVPCPKCGAVTREMASLELSVVPMCLGICALGVALIAIVYIVGRATGRWFYVLGLMGIVIACGGSLLLVSTWFQGPRPLVQGHPLLIHPTIPLTPPRLIRTKSRFFNVEVGAIGAKRPKGMCASGARFASGATYVLRSSYFCYARTAQLRTTGLV